MSRDIDEVETVSKISSEAQVDSKKLITHSHDFIEDKEIGDFPRRRSRRQLSESSSDSRISMSRDINEVETVSKISSEAQVDSKKVSHSSLGESPSTQTSISDPAVSGNLRNDPTSEDNESDEDLDAISLFAETDIGFEQRPVEVRPKIIHPDNPFAKSDSDSDISNNSDNESRPLVLPVPEFINYLNTEKETHQTVTNIPLNDEVDSNKDFPRWRSDIYQECDQSSGNENDGSDCSDEVPCRVGLDSHNTSSLTAEDRLDTYDDAHGMTEEREFETENENKYFTEEDNLEDMRYNGTANIDSPNLSDKAAEQHCETNIAHYDMSGYLMQHGNREDVNPMGYQSPSQHSSSSCRKPQEGKFCFTFLKYGNCKKYPHNCTYNHCVPNKFSDTDLRNKLQISRSSSASSQECSPQDKPTRAHADLPTQHNNRNTNMRRLTRQGKQPSPLDSIPDQTDHILHSQNITRVEPEPTETAEEGFETQNTTNYDDNKLKTKTISASSSRQKKFKSPPKEKESSQKIPELKMPLNV
uniref:Uncharacterized protein n=1 Tax=Timema monikensis TaxID=170555 RepID=A0A7R9EFL7_9NEOP|nr:unnamed protein product [Timema monikensis]